MFRKWGEAVYRLRYGIVVVWLAIIAAAITLLPSLNSVVAHKNTTYLSATSPVVVASQLLHQVDPAHASNSTVVLAIHHGTGLTTEDDQYFTDELKKLNQNREHYDISNVQAKYNTDASIAKNFESHDNTTEIAIVGLKSSVGNQNLPTHLNQIKTEFASPPRGAHVYVTGDAPIQQDNIDIAQSGVGKTVIVTIVLVLLILLIVFRSVLAPVLTLIAIGLSFEFSANLVAELAGYGLPVSSFTQTFLIATLFGAGTDYSIILLNRFREELSHAGANRQIALEATLAGVGKTVVYSSMTVIVAFAALYFANFGLYQSAVGVSIGILITLITCLAFLPALMGILGGALYWPRKPIPGQGHSPSRLWGATARTATRRPWTTILVLLIVLVPIAFLFTDDRTFDPQSDIPQAPSIRGLQVVSDAMGAGRVMPSSIVLQTGTDLRSQAGLATIQRISVALASVSGVDSVQSATQPTGTPITGFQLSQQNNLAAQGLQKVQTGLAQLQTQFQSNEESNSQAKKLNRLVTGAKQVSSGVGSLSQGLHQYASQMSKLQTGTSRLFTGADSLRTGLGQLQSGLTASQTGAKQLQSGLDQAATAAGQVQSGSASLQSSEHQLANTAEQLANAIAAWTKAHSSDAKNPNWQEIIKLSAGLEKGSSAAASGASQLSVGAKQLTAGITPLQGGAEKLVTGLNQASSAAGQLTTGASSLYDGAASLHQGTTAAVDGAAKLAAGARPLVNGSKQVAAGVTQIPGTMQGVSQGLVGASAGIQAMNEGTKSVIQALHNSTQAASVGDPGFYVPAAAVTSNASLKQAMDAYISPDGQIAKFTIVLANNPYSEEAMNTVNPLKSAASLALAGSPIHTGTIYATGTTPTQAELNRVSSLDFTRTMTIILVAIYILLTLMLQSLIAPIYIIISLAGTYFVTMGLLQVFTIHGLHKSGLSWPVPFFVFLLLVALGVDYSIFLMARFEESYRNGMSPRAAVSDAMEKMGGVIFSAAAIMAGTFGSMMVAGVVSLLEIGLAVVVGLLLYTFVLLAFFVPSAVSVVGRGHGWPFQTAPDEDRGTSRALKRTDGRLV